MFLKKKNLLTEKEPYICKAFLEICYNSFV